MPKSADTKSKKVAPEPKKSSRVIALDLMRGWFLVAILLDHLGYFPNGIDMLTGRGNLYVSAAEGFFFISGLVLGIVRGRKLLDQPFKVAAKLLLKRGVQLYITAIVLFFVFTFIGWQFLGNEGLKPGIRPIDQNFGEIIWGALTFHYIYGWADYLRLYAIYLFASPLVIWLLRRGLWWLVLAASLAVWTVFDYSPIPGAELSQVWSWQIIFFGGMVAGFHLENIKGWWRKLGRRWREAIIITTGILAVTTAIANYLLIFHGSGILGADLANQVRDTLGPHFNKFRLPFERIGLFLLWFSGFFWIFHRLEKHFVRWLGWLLIPFGTNSLYVYTIEAFLIFLIHLWIPRPTEFWGLNLLLATICAGLTLWAVRRKFLMGIIPR